MTIICIDGEILPLSGIEKVEEYYNADYTRVYVRFVFISGRTREYEGYTIKGVLKALKQPTDIKLVAWEGDGT